MKKSMTMQPSPKIIFGCGSINQLAGELEAYKINKVAIVTDRGLKSTGIVEMVTDICHKHDVAFSLFDNIEPDPPIKNAIQAAAFSCLSSLQVV